jgi:putative FmdB family regulatory protein
MPIYEYVCSKCGKEFEFLTHGSDTPICPACGNIELIKNFSAPAAHTGGTKDPACPSHNSCPMPNCCGGGCGFNAF